MPAFSAIQQPEQVVHSNPRKTYERSDKSKPIENT